MSVNVNALNENQLIAAFGFLAAEPLRTTIVEAPKIAPYLADFALDRADMRSFDVVPPPATPSNPQAGNIADRRVEAAVHALKSLLEALSWLAFARGDDARADQIAAIDDAIFGGGLQFLSQNWSVQIVATERCLDRAKTAALMEEQVLDGVTWAQLIALATTRNNELRPFDAKQIASPTKATGELTLSTVVRRAKRHLRSFLGVVNTELPEADKEAIFAAVEHGARNPYRPGQDDEEEETAPSETVVTPPPKDPNAAATTAPDLTAVPKAPPKSS